jgi:hypothetical protein
VKNGHRHSDVKLSPKEAMDLLEVSDSTLRRWRKCKIGPAYYREVSRIFYYREDIDAWRQASKWR